MHALGKAVSGVSETVGKVPERGCGVRDPCISYSRNPQDSYAALSPPRHHAAVAIEPNYDRARTILANLEEDLPSGRSSRPPLAAHGVRAIE